MPTANENADPNGDGNPDDALDTDGDGTPDYLDVDTPVGNVDSDDDGLSDAQEAVLGTNPASSDSDNDGVPDAEEVGPDLDNPRNTDGDDLINALDPDDDNDGILTINEDLNGNGYPGDDIDPVSGQAYYLTPAQAPTIIQIWMPLIIR